LSIDIGFLLFLKPPPNLPHKGRGFLPFPVLQGGWGRL